MEPRDPQPPDVWSYEMPAPAPAPALTNTTLIYDVDAPHRATFLGASSSTEEVRTLRLVDFYRPDDIEIGTSCDFVGNRDWWDVTWKPAGRPVVRYAGPQDWFIAFYRGAFISTVDSLRVCHG